MDGVRRAPDVVSRRLGKSILLAAPHRSNMDELSPTAAMVWACTDDDAVPVDQIVRWMNDLYEGTPPDLEEGVTNLVDDLVARGWLEEAPITADG